MEKKNIASLSRNIEHKLQTRYEDKTLCNQYAWWMIETVTQKKKAELLAQKEFNFTKKQIDTLKDWILKQIEEKEPLQYLLGSVPFDGLEILVEPPILIPRPETEELCYKIISYLNNLKYKKLTILDIGTGSGCIALTLAKALPESTIYATDISEKALSLAQKNAKHNGIQNIKFIKSDVYDQLYQSDKNIKFDLIISNPPYITKNEWQDLDESVKNWEDTQALVANHEGLEIIEKIILGAPQFLKKNTQLIEKKIPQLIIEIGYKQGSSVAKLFEKANFVDIVVEKDLENKDRFVKGSMYYVAEEKK